MNRNRKKLNCLQEVIDHRMNDTRNAVLEANLREVISRIHKRNRIKKDLIKLGRPNSISIVLQTT